MAITKIQQSASHDVFAENWGLEDSVFVRESENRVFVGRYQGLICYLRITPAGHRSEGQLVAEMDLLQYLDACGLSVNQPIADGNGNYVATADDGGASSFACLFTGCPGEDLRENPPRSWSDFLCDAGFAMGRLHRALSDYPEAADLKRSDWFDHRWKRFEKTMPLSESEAWACYEDMNQWSVQLSQDDQQLIHGDFTINNLRYSKPLVSLYDFDGFCRNWRSYEIACLMHYPLLVFESGRLSALLDSFARGYQKEISLPPNFREQLNRFSKMKMLRSHLVFGETFGFQELDDNQASSLQKRRSILVADELWR